MPYLAGHTVLLAAHANTLRALLCHLDMPIRKESECIWARKQNIIFTSHMCS